MQADNGKEFKGALLILLRKYGIQVVNGAPQSPQTQGLVEQANGVVEAKLRAWKMDHGSTEWKDGLLEVTLAMNTQIHSTIGCAPAELLFREQSSHINWLNSQARKDLTIGIEQEDPTMGPIFESELQPELESEREPELRIELSGSELYSEPSSGSELEPEPERELDSGLRTQTGTRARNRSGNRSRIRTGTQARARARAQLQREPELGIELSGSGLNSEQSASSELEPEREQELHSELRRGNRARVPAQPRTELRVDPIIEKATVATQKARVSMMRKYTKKHDIQHFDIGAIVSLKIPREDRTSTDNKRGFARILEEPYPHRYRVITLSGIIQRLIPTKSLGAVEQALWSD
ncbi:hypothetical protein V502_09981, partial [Pseudogymnoascus sp. VKM F-4520 (FW-2644)]